MTIRVAAAIVLLLTIAACSRAQSSTPGPTAKRAPDAQVVARIGDHTFTLDEVDKQALQIEAGTFSNLKLVQAMYEARRQVLDAMIGAYLVQAEARARGLDEAALVKHEITDRLKPVTDANVEAWYKANQDRVGALH